MDTTTPPAVFAGDLDDPWVLAIAAALPGPTLRVPCGDRLPDPWPAGSERAPVLVLHRAVLTDPDAERLARARRAGWTPKVVLCVGPHARYHQVQRWATGLVDEVVPEAIAPDVIARHVGAPPQRGPRPTPRPPLIVVSGQHETRTVLTAIGQEAGYSTRAVHSWSEAPSGGLAVWDVPVLEPSWPDVLAALSSGRRIVALLGFADRASVATARRAGAAACLDAACDPADLLYILDRLTTLRREPGHDLPRPPAQARRRGAVAEPDMRT